MNRAPKKKKKRKILQHTACIAAIVSEPYHSVADETDINEKEHKTYELDATVLDGYAASGLPELPGLFFVEQ